MNEADQSPDLSGLSGILERNGYAPTPDFVMWGRLPKPSKLSLSSTIGTGISAVAAFPGFLVHVFGRLGTDSGIKFLASDQLVIREIPYSDVEGVDFTTVEGVGVVVTLSVRSKGGVLQKALTGGDVVVTMPKEEIDSVRALVEQLRARVSS